MCIRDSSDILPIPQSYLYEKYNIPQPEGDEAIARKEQHPQFVLPPEEDLDIMNQDRAWYARLWDFFAGAPQAGATSGKASIRLSDDTMQNRIINRVANGNGKTLFDAELFGFFSDDFVRAVGEGRAKVVGLADTTFTYGARDDAFITSMETNVFHFSAAKTLAELQELNSLFRESGSFEEFHKKALQTTDVFNKRWQQTEYETAVLTAESASNYQRLVGKTRLFPYWEYKTAGDDKVREEHRKLDGLVLPANDPRWDKIFPPNGWKCRCYVVPLMGHEAAGVDLEAEQARCEAFFDTPEWKKAQAQHWDTNRGKRSEVFNKDQMYIHKFPDVAGKQLGNIPLDTWGVTPSLKKRIGESTVPMPVYEGDASTWWNLHCQYINGKEALPVTDHNGRTWFMGKSDYDAHTSNKRKKREFRTTFLSCIQDIMADPDELWLGQEYKDRDNKESKLTNYIWIKYYKERAVACVSKVENNRMVFKSWFEVRNPKIRSGLLLRKKK